MIRRIICFFKGHNWATRQEVWFNTRTTSLALCHRCSKIEWL